MPSNPTFLIRPGPVLLFRKNHNCPSWLSTGHVESQCTRNARNQLEAGILSLGRLSLGCTAAVMTTISGEMQRCAVVRIKSEGPRLKRNASSASRDWDALSSLPIEWCHQLVKVSRQLRHAFGAWQRQPHCKCRQACSCQLFQLEWHPAVRIFRVRSNCAGRKPRPSASQLGW